MNCQKRNSQMNRKDSGYTLVEVLVGPDGSFTAFLTLPEGLACPLAAGEGWRALSRQSREPAA